MIVCPHGRPIAQELGAACGLFARCLRHRVAADARLQGCSRNKKLGNLLLAYMRLLLQGQFRGSIVASMSACHAEDPGSIPGSGVVSLPHALVFFEWLRCERKCARVCKEKEA